MKRLAGSLPDYLPDFVPKELKEQISTIMVDDSQHNRIKFYDDWCDKYDEDLVSGGQMGCGGDPGSMYGMMVSIPGPWWNYVIDIWSYME